MDFQVSDRVLEMLEWSALEAALAAETVTPGGRELALARRWFSDDEVEERLDEVTEARSLIRQGANPLRGGTQEIEAHLEQAAKGKVLGGTELLRVGETLKAARLVAGALRKRRSETPRLSSLADAVPDLSDLERTLLGAFDPRGRLLDAASPKLAEARREAAALASKIQKHMTSALGSPAYASHLQDQFYTLRGDRYVLPIKIESRGRIRGIVHDVSASGTTVFVEPEEVVDLNNRLRYAELEEERESIRILSALSAAVGARLAEIREAGDALSRFDRIMAAARLAERLSASRPRILPGAELSLRQARHPLLALRDGEVVPNDIALGRAYDALILTGPNAGGKTVGLKTAGLLVLMTRAGLHLPAAEGSAIGLFRRVHADIGDDQNLAESLSTFSGQVQQIRRFLEACDERTLVLLDEIIVGTDPTEGAALAQAVLEALVSRGARIIVTTHYPGLKELAAQHPRFENASMEFDPETQRLTYRMMAGVSGRSGALEIAGRLGLDGAVIARARSLLGSDRREIEQRLRRLDELRLDLETEKREVERRRAQTEEARQTWVEKLRQIEQARLEISRDMKTALDAEVRRAHEEIAAVIRDLQRKGTAQQAGAARRRIVGLEDRLKSRLPAPPAEAPSVDWSKFPPGTPLRLHRAGLEGELLEGPNAAGKIKARVGGKRMWIPAGEAAPAPEAPPPGPPPRRATPALSTAHREDAVRTSANTLDLRGLRVDEAESKLVYFLDKLYGAGEATAYLIHGHGTGALKSAIRAYLDESPYVARFRPADSHEGGDGVTIVSLGS